MPKQPVPPLPPNSWLVNYVLDRLKDGGDVKIVTTARNAETNIGKTILNLWLAETFNPGFSPRNAAYHKPEPYLVRYLDGPPGEVLMLEEAQKLSKRRAMQKENVDAIEIWMEGRKRQKISLLTLPDVTWLDKDIKKNCHIWCHVLRKGRVRVHDKFIHDYDPEVFNPQREELEFPNLDYLDSYQELEKMKEEKFEERVGELQSASNSNKLLTPKEAGERLGCSSSKIRSLCNDMTLDSIRVNERGDRRISAESVDKHKKAVQEKQEIKS